jgi:hypothetical protein
VMGHVRPADDRADTRQGCVAKTPGRAEAAVRSAVALIYVRLNSATDAEDQCRYLQIRSYRQASSDWLFHRVTRPHTSARVSLHAPGLLYSAAVHDTPANYHLRRVTGPSWPAGHPALAVDDRCSPLSGYDSAPFTWADCKRGGAAGRQARDERVR